MVLMCFSEDSKDEMELTASSSSSFSLIHKEKASDSLLKCSHHIHTFSNLTMLQEQSVHCCIYSQEHFKKYEHCGIDAQTNDVLVLKI